MSRLLKVYLCLLTILLLLTNCRKKGWDDYYGRPAGLAQPIYQQLEARGNFKSFLKLVDRAKYKNILSTGGYWTCFAPNDAAFEKFLQANKYSSINDIDDATAGKIVRYMIVYSAYDSAKLDDYQMPVASLPDFAFKRKTTYYNWIGTDTLYNGRVVKIMDATTNLYTSLNPDETNNKNIEYFTSAFFATKGLTADDYNYFYPNTPFSGYNVLDANVLTKGVLAENGYYYEIDKVILPPLSIYEYISSKPEYSEFKQLLDLNKGYGYSSSLQNRYLQATGLSDSVFIRMFSSALAFSPAGEKFLNQTSMDAQQDGWSIFVPTNDVLLDYEKNVLAEYYNHDPNRIPFNVSTEFLNAHMWQTTVWPSKFVTTNNFLGEEARFNPKADIVDKQILSNGFFYGVNKVQKSNTFKSVYAAPFLNPSYSYMIRLMGMTLKNILVSPRIKATLFLVTDLEYQNRSFTYNINYNSWMWKGSSAVPSQWMATAKDKMNRDLNLQIIYTYNGELNDLSGSGIVKTYGQECIKFQNNQVFGAGNLDSLRKANVLGYREYDNGRVYFIDKPLEYSEISPAEHIRELAGYSRVTGWGAPTSYYSFFKYLTKSGLLAVTSGDSSRMLITGVSTGDFYTFFVPTNAAIDQAHTDKVLPDLTAADAVSLLLMKQFILYHIVNKIVIANGDEGDNGKTNTAFKNLDGITQTVTLINQKNNLQITDINGKTVSVINANSNNLSSNAVIHQVDNYLNVIKL